MDHVICRPLRLIMPYFAVIHLQTQVFYNVERPIPLADQDVNLDNQGSTWTLRVQLKFLFPKGG
jgi:hypothetical protein